MQRFSPLLVLSLSTLVLAGCASAPPRGVDALIAADMAFSDDSKASGPYAAWNAWLADNAVSMPAGADFEFDKATTLKGFEHFPQSASLTWKPVGGMISKSGDLGYTFGRYTLESKTSSGETRSSRGKYVTIWQRQPDNSWKVIFDGGNSSPAPVGASTSSAH